MGTFGAPLARIVVGVDGSRASIEALRQAQRLAMPLGAKIVATAYWDDPQVYAGYVMME
jgi:nucleotide-binding universal stress UspA family protein